MLVPGVSMPVRSRNAHSGQPAMNEAVYSKGPGDWTQGEKLYSANSLLVVSARGHGSARIPCKERTIAICTAR